MDSRGSTSLAPLQRSVTNIHIREKLDDNML